MSPSDMDDFRKITAYAPLNTEEWIYKKSGEWIILNDIMPNLKPHPSGIMRRYIGNHFKLYQQARKQEEPDPLYAYFGRTKEDINRDTDIILSRLKMTAYQRHQDINNEQEHDKQIDMYWDLPIMNYIETLNPEDEKTRNVIFEMILGFRFDLTVNENENKLHSFNSHFDIKPTPTRFSSEKVNLWSNPYK